MATMQHVAVIVAQSGADVACHVDAAPPDTAVEVFQQANGETQTQLFQRLRSRLSALSASGVRVESAAFVAKAGFDSDEVLHAAGLVRGLVALMVAVGAGKVRLHALPRDRQAEVALTALTDALVEQLRGTGVSLESAPVRIASSSSGGRVAFA
jgi:hypothetical protein